MRYKTLPRQRRKAPRLKRALCTCVLLTAVLTTSGCLGVTYGWASLDKDWPLDGGVLQIGLSAFMPTPGSDRVMPEFGVTAGIPGGTFYSGSFKEMHAGIRALAAPYDMSEDKAKQTVVPYVAAGVTSVSAKLEENFGNMETDSTLGIYVRVGMTVRDIFAFEGRYVLGTSLNLFGQDLDLDGFQASIWFRLDVFLMLLLTGGHAY